MKDKLWNCILKQKMAAKNQNMCKLKNCQCRRRKSASPIVFGKSN